MSRTALSLSLLSLVALGAVCVAAHSRGDEDADTKAVHRAVADYLEGLYDVKPEFIERSVHPELTKLGFWRNDEGEYQAAKMTYPQLHGLAARWNEDGKQVTEDSPRDIRVIEVNDQTAIAKLTAEWGIDYFHLAKFQGRWQIVHVLWQTHPPKAAKGNR